MQGSIPGPLFCSNQMASIANKCYRDGMVYMYMGRVPIPHLCMVDDIATVNLCDTTEGIDVNVKCDVLVRAKKLEYQVKKGKCQVIHIGSRECNSKSFAHDKPLIKVKEGKYLADYVSDDPQVLFSKRLESAHGYANQCLGMVMEISLGFNMFKVAKLLHESIFVNGCMTNMETWTCFGLDEISEYERVQQYFLRRLLNAHSKTPIEALYLELGIYPLRYHLHPQSRPGNALSG